MPRLGSRILFTAPVLVGHILFPLSLLLHLWSASSQDRMTWLAALYVAGAYFAFLYLAGSWSWFGGMVRHIIPTFLLVTVWATYLHGNPNTILDFTPSPDFLLSILMGTVFAALTIFSVRGRKGPSGVELFFPLRGGTFCIAQGGASRMLNVHYVHPSQKYAIDMVKLFDSGVRARGLYPPTPDRYGIWEAEVVSPCEGRVLEAIDGIPDLFPPVRDPVHPAGNHIVIESAKGTTVYLAHLRQGSICVRTGERIRAGQTLGRVGNSGNTTEPHLHLHAEEGPYSEGVSNRPGLPIRFDGRFLVRNDMVRVRAGVTVAAPEDATNRALSSELPVVGDSAVRTRMERSQGL